MFWLKITGLVTRKKTAATRPDVLLKNTRFCWSKREAGLFICSHSKLLSVGTRLLTDKIKPCFQIDPVVADTCTETCLTHEWKHASLPAPTSPSRLYQSIFRLGFLLRLHRSIRAGPTCREAIHPLFSCLLLLLRHLRLSPSASLSVFCQHLQGRSRPRRVSSFSSSLSLCGFGIFIRVPFFFVPPPRSHLSTCGDAALLFLLQFFHLQSFFCLTFLALYRYSASIFICHSPHFPFWRRKLKPEKKGLGRSKAASEM